jgi:hypothetical protein
MASVDLDSLYKRSQSLSRFLRLTILGYIANQVLLGELYIPTSLVSDPISDPLLSTMALRRKCSKVIILAPTIF